MKVLSIPVSRRMYAARSLNRRLVSNAARIFSSGIHQNASIPATGSTPSTRITKVVAGQTADVAEELCEIYSAVTSGGVFPAADIKTAEAAKVIENAQRDINIAFVNEVATIFHKMGISIHDVLEAAGTKWNFLDFRPGLVGGHCIGVDPFYLAHAAVSVGHHPEIVLAGRRINDAMGPYVAECIASELVQQGYGVGARILVLGLTFKENVPDLRNSWVIDIVTALQVRGLRWTSTIVSPTWTKPNRNTMSI